MSKVKSSSEILYHPVTGEPLSPLPQITKDKVLKRDGSGAYVTRAGDPVKQPEPRIIMEDTTPPPIVQIKPPTRSEIKLVYKYLGDCSDCGGEIETIELDDLVDDKKKVAVIAWCGKCRKKIRQRFVIKL